MRPRLRSLSFHVFAQSGHTPQLEHGDQNRAQCEELTDFHADVEGNEVGNQRYRGDLEVQDLRGEAEPGKSQKTSVATFVFGWNPNHRWNVPRLSSAFYTTERLMIASIRYEHTLTPVRTPNTNAV